MNKEILGIERRHKEQENIINLRMNLIMLPFNRVLLPLVYNELKKNK